MEEKLDIRTLSRHGGFFFLLSSFNFWVGKVVGKGCGKGMGKGVAEGVGGIACENNISRCL
jgi:hypothetical protein